MKGFPRKRYFTSSIARGGFTVVELLIVIVVIAILAVITIVAYRGITAGAAESSLRSDLSTAAKRLNVEKVDAGSFPTAKPGYIGGALYYIGGGANFCVSGETNGKGLHVTDGGTINEGSCPLPVATTMQTFTPAHCSALPIYTGSNSETIQNLTDSRGSIPRSYEVAKLADGNCWMLNNLKLGGSSPITLTPADSDVESNFTLPALVISGTTSYDEPTVAGPVPGDTGAGATNYGYLYNFSAATAGESRTSHDRYAGNAPHSICPANWRLPADPEFSALDIAFGGTGSNSSNGPSQSSWLNAGAFKGSFAGRWIGGGFTFQGTYGFSRSATAIPGDSLANHAFVAVYGLSDLSPGSAYYDRSSGIGIRCLLR